MRKKRIFAFVIDMVIINVFALIIDHLAKISFGPWAVYVSALYMTMFLLKDSFGKPSIGHRLMKIKICVNGKQISPFLAFLRNLTYFIWFVELLCLWVCNKRIGDYIVKSQVIDASQDEVKYSYKVQGNSIILFLGVFAFWSLLIYLLVMKYPTMLLL